MAGLKQEPARKEIDGQWPDGYICTYMVAEAVEAVWDCCALALRRTTGAAGAERAFLF